MKYLYIIAFILLVSGESCKEHITSPLTQSNLQLNFVQGSIGANLMPIILPDTIPIPSDPFGCRLVLVAKNTSQTNTLSNIQIKQANVYLSSANQEVGTWFFSTSWDGWLEPGASDTVTLTKSDGSTSNLLDLCDRFLYLSLNIQIGSNKQTTFKSDSIGVLCVY
jgi:hypothetical protein